jgi:para-nitrobenzyl esterase
VEALVVKAKEHLPVDITSATADGWVLPMSPQQALLTGAIRKVDLLIGLNGRELSAFRLAAAAAAKASGNASNTEDPGAMKKFVEAAHPYFGRWTYLAIGRYFGKMLLNKNAGLDAAANDLIGTCPIGAMASLAHAAGQRVFVYRFDRSIPGKGEAELGAFHSLEVPYVFGSLQTKEWQWLPTTADDAALSDLLQTYWTNFAKTGDPNRADRNGADRNGSGLPRWPAWSDDSKEFLIVNKDASVSTQRNFPPLFSHLGAKELEQNFKAN